MPYIGVLSNRGKEVIEEDAFDYALEQIKNNPEEKKEFIEWFYSGNWIKKDNPTENE